MSLVAGIDSSTQSCKVVVVDKSTGATVRSGRSTHASGTEIDPELWWSALAAAITDAGGLDGVDAVAVAGQQHGMVALDAAGAVIRPALLWNDNRSAGAAADLIEEWGAAELAHRTGSVPVASFTITKLRWLQDAEPENAARVAAIALPHDWLTWRLRGFGPDNPVLEELTTDASDASGTGYWSPQTGEYDLALVRSALRLGADDAVPFLPRVLAAGERAGVTPDSPVLPGVGAGIVVAPGAGDNAGAALGLGTSRGDVIVSIGTSGTAFAVSDTPAQDPSGAVAGFSNASGSFLPLVATLNAARVFDSIAALLGVDHDELGRLALQAEPGADGLVLQSYFEGERTPNLPNASGTLFGMTLASTNRPALARAAIEGVLCSLANGIDALIANGVTPERLLLIGGASQNPALPTIAAQVFDTPVVVPRPGEYVAIGACAHAAWALDGERPTWPIALSAEPARDTRPIIREQYARHL